jgi:hypothetical protein
MGPAQSRLSESAASFLAKLDHKLARAASPARLCQHGAALRRQRQSIGHLAASDGRSAASFCRWRYTVCIRAEGQRSAVDGRGSPLRVQISDPSNRRGRRRMIARTQPAGRPVPPTPRPCPRGMDGPCYQRGPDTIAPGWLDRTSILQRRQSLTNHPAAIHSRSNYQLTNHS